jgi:hypothetical protein
MENVIAESQFPVRFTGQLRPAQLDAVAAARRDLEAGKKRIHIVAPPGSGKTVLGLYLWSEFVRRPALVLSPNSAIQAQWAARTSLFQFDDQLENAVSIDPQRPGLLTSLTYQSVTLPRRGGPDLDDQAVDLWCDRLVEEGEAEDLEEAQAWIDGLKLHNRDYHDDRLGGYRKAVRDRMASGGDVLKTLHESSLATLARLRDREVGLVILDECHHLMGHWGRVLADARGLLADPVVIGLTATPPDRSGKPAEDVGRYDEFFGPVDYEVPVPAVVKDGFLAPFQDLAYLVRPTGDELAYLATIDGQFKQMVEELCKPPREDAQSNDQRESLIDWVVRVLRDRALPTGRIKDWAGFERRDPELSRSGRVFLDRIGRVFPVGVPALEGDLLDPEISLLDVVVPVLDRYVRHRLLRSPITADQELAQRVIRRLRVLGVQITETGSRACASPAARVMAYSRAKTDAVIPILKAEREILGDRIRAVIIADYEKTSAVSAEVDHLLDEEAGGAVAAFRALLSDPETDALDPVLVTGSTVLVDDDLAERFMASVKTWLAAQGLDIELSYTEEDGFFVLDGRGDAWCPRVYVRMITELFQQGLTKCLVGTRGLLGEGWDASKINVLVNLAAVTTSMSVGQLRGRSIRLDPDDPEKLADNWDVVCIAPEFSKGMDDYGRFIDRHKTVHGLTDDGAIEKGVGHVHAAFTELKPEGVEGSLTVLNAEMLSRADRREEFRALWRIGQPFNAEPVQTVEIRNLGHGLGGGFPPFKRSKEPWSGASLSLAVGHAVLGALQDTALVTGKHKLHVGDRAGGYVRMFLEDAAESDSVAFAESLAEALGPLDRPRYVIPRFADEIRETWLSGILPAVLARYFRKRNRCMATLHAVPSALARKKTMAEIYAQHWNRHVSPGEPLYAHRGEGEELLRQARQDGHVPQSGIHQKEVFV